MMFKSTLGEMYVSLFKYFIIFFDILNGFIKENNLINKKKNSILFVKF